jgi:hypothetical protein
MLLQFSHYFWPSVFGIIPGLIIYVWLGSLAADVTEAMAGHSSVRAPPAGDQQQFQCVTSCCPNTVLKVNVLSCLHVHCGAKEVGKRLGVSAVPYDERMPVHV